MKKTLLFLIVLFTTMTSFAQLTNGHIKYTINITSANPEMEMAVSMLQGSSLDIFFEDKKTRSEMQMGAMMKIVTITDTQADAMLMLMSGMIGNKAIISKLSEVEGENAEAQKPNFEVELLNESKAIMGYTCKKAIVKDEDGNVMNFWYTEEIAVDKSGQKYLSADVPGFPLEFELAQGDLLMAMTVTELDKKLKKTTGMFDLKIPEGYEEITMEQLQSMGM